MRRKTILFVALLMGLALFQSARAQTTEITYQGQLQNSSAPATGSFDFEFLLFDAPSGGSQIGSTLTRNGVPVANGIFSVNLDFGSSFPGSNRFLEIRVKQSGGGAFTGLNPRQPITSSPYSVKSLTADTATNAVTAVNATAAATATSFSGPLAGDVTGTQGSTTVARLQGRNVSNTAPLNDQVLKFNTATNQWLPGTDNTSGGAGNAILNQTTPQAGANFNISGEGIAGGTLSGSVVNSGGQYNIAGARVLSTIGSANLYIGLGAGQSVPSGFDNTFVGTTTGAATTSGSLNSFFGRRAGAFTTTGLGNTFLGRDAGVTNTSGISNTAVGSSADVGSGGLSFATAIGAGSVVSTNSTLVLGRPADTVQVPGNLVVAGTFTGNINGASITNLNASNISTGTLDSGRLGVVPVANGGTGSATQNFVDLTTAQTIAGNKTFSATLSGNVVSATTQFNIGSDRVLSNAGTNNLFAGVGAGLNTTGSGNAFFGRQAGETNTSGVNNTFFGGGAGFGNTSGFSNDFFGGAVGNTNTTGSNNTLVGDLADVTVSNLIFATAIGAQSKVSTNNTVVLGRAADTVQVPGNLNVTGTFTGNINGASITNLNASNIATGTLNNARLGVVPVANGGTGSATQNFVDLTSEQTIAGNKTFSSTLSGSVVSANQFNMGGSSVISIAGSNNLFVGIGAGFSNTTGNRNSFFGLGAGNLNTTGIFNSYFGMNAGLANTTGNRNAFFGQSTGVNNTVGAENAFFGENAGVQNTTGSFNASFGRLSGSTNTTGSNNTMIGFDANVQTNNLDFATAIGSGSRVSTSNTVVLGRSADAVQIPGTALDVNGPVTSTRTAVAQQSIEINGGNGSSIRLTAQSAAAADKPLLIQNLSAEAAPTANNNIQFQVGTTASPSTKMTIDASGDVGIGTTTPNDKLEVNGSIRVTTLGAAGATTLCRNASNQISTCSSSARYKSNIMPFGSGLSLVRQLRPVSFNWKDGGMLDMGLVAEEVNAIEPLLTNLNDKGQVEGVKYDRVGVILINAVKEQQAQIEEQRKLIDQQRAENEVLKARIIAIEKALTKRP